MKKRTAIEALEIRIAPAAIFTFTDVDGDAVTVTTSKGTNAELAATISTTAAGAGTQLREIDLSMNAAVFAGTDLIVSVVKKPGGDGLVNIGYVDASDIDGSGTNLDLGTVSIPGDLGQVDAGDANSNTLAIKSLKVRSMGTLGLATQGGTGSLTSTVIGSIGSITVKGDIRDASISASGNVLPFSIGTLTIGGSLIGGATASSGLISGAAAIGKVSIVGSIIGGAGADSGKLSFLGDIGSVKVGGDIVGSMGARSGSIVSAGTGTIKSLTIGGSLVGGSGLNAGYIESNGSGAAVVKIGRNIVGNAGVESGFMEFEGLVSSLTVGGSVTGGTDDYAGGIDLKNAGVIKIVGSIVGGSASDTGYVHSDSATSVFIGGSIFGGSANTAGQLDLFDITTLSIKGSIIGGTGNASGMVYVSDVKSVLIGGDIVGSDISAGTAVLNGMVRSPSGKIGSMTIGGSIIGGSVTGTGTQNHSGSLDLNEIGTLVVKGSLIAGQNTGSGTLTYSGAIVCDTTIGALTINGSVIGTATHRATIAAGGPGTGTTQELAIAKLTIGGNVTRTDILGGIGLPPYNQFLDGDASIGAVVVKGDWTASSISAGVRDMGTNGFGGADDVILPDNNNATIASRIASIVIGGTIGGSANAGDTFGFVAQQIGSVKIGGSTIFTGTTATDAVKAIPNITNDLFIREVA